ncbi:nicotinate-nucleotide adenylyltransferase [Syntrophothermus lipocalidus]|uniref:Probable nicotinate-nucleotide adenylyltransferase n=1 Tax=Syntrophothermus lipocalidus (strain DSM 12680 / TGB-C1) TaxID=643648 RepID=D7CP04_SYNLT|nr:nicotinate-nucleotide adenylyltransferase [Syntrophothermus lipocalidus]ADI02439.1 nicotinate (nicotinamide) nucleotide adenylyltransferase [Syntrophothermus lipocalidus DSM 12680]
MSQQQASIFKRIGLFGGTFDPVHYGHLVLAECARYECELDRVIFIPSARPPHKHRETVLGENYRYEMVRLAIKDNPFFEVSKAEIDRPGYSYAIDTVRYFRFEYPEAEIYFITGLDALLDLKSWKDVGELIKLCRFITAVRPGFELKEDDERLKGLPAEFWRNLRVIEVPGLHISSTDLRYRIATGKPVRYLLPRPVEDYIREHGFYRE